MTEVLFPLFVALAIGCLIWGLFTQFEVVGYTRFYARLAWARLTWRWRTWRPFKEERATITIHGKPGELIQLDDFRVRTADGKEVSVGKGALVIPSSGSIDIATITSIKSSRPRR